MESPQLMTVFNIIKRHFILLLRPDTLRYDELCNWRCCHYLHYHYCFCCRQEISKYHIIDLVYSFKKGQTSRSFPFQTFVAGTIGLENSPNRSRTTPFLSSFPTSPDVGGKQRKYEIDQKPQSLGIGEISPFVG